MSIIKSEQAIQFQCQKTRQQEPTPTSQIAAGFAKKLKAISNSISRGKHTYYPGAARAGVTLLRHGTGTHHPNRIRAPGTMPANHSQLPARNLGGVGVGRRRTDDGPTVATSVRPMGHLVRAPLAFPV